MAENLESRASIHNLNTEDTVIRSKRATTSSSFHNNGTTSTSCSNMNRIYGVSTNE